MTADFEGSTVGTLPSVWKLAGTVPGTSASVVSSYAGNATKTLWFHDSNTTTANNTVYTTFPSCNRGRCTLQFDVCLASIHAGFGVRITNGDVPTSGGNWGAALKFEGDSPYAPTGAVGTLSYQEYMTGTNAYTAVSPSVSYQAGVWYTAKIDADLDSKTYKIYFGQRGGALTCITPAGVAFIKGTNNAQISTAGGMTVYSSTKLEPDSNLYIDNITVTSSVESPGTTAEVKQLSMGSGVALQDQVVTAGTDQMTGPFFYIQDQTGGIRVRTNATVRQGDKVSIYGAIQRTNDGGVATRQTCEREINALSLTVTYGPFPMPKPVGISNRCIGGGPFGPIDADGYACQPGVWAGSNGAASGFDQISEAGLNNLGRLCRVWGRIVYADDVNRFFYVNDGSDVQDGSRLADGTASPSGIRVLVAPGVPLTGIVGKYATVAGVVGAVAQSEAGAPRGPGGDYVRSVRVVRATCEPFLDLNLNGYWDTGEAFVDANASGGYDGIRVEGVPGPNVISGFDRYGTAIVRGRPFLIKGIYVYSVDTPTLDEMVRQNFNTVVCFDTNPGALADIGAHGLKTMPCLREESKRAGWMAAKNDPAIVGWYTHDEPEGQGVSAAQALIDYQWVKSQDASHFAGESHFLQNGFYDYAPADEFNISDCYPLTDPSAGIIPIAGVLGFAKGAHGNNCYYPAFQFVQLFGGAPQVLPTPAQVRAITYLALMFNARGILYFSYQRLNSQWWDDWAEVKKMNGEMDQFQPFLVMPWSPLEATTSNEAVRIGGYRVGGSALIITVNVTSSPATATFNLPGIGASELSLPLEGTTQPLVNRSFTYTYAPYQTRVMVWGSIPPAP